MADTKEQHNTGADKDSLAARLASLRDNTANAEMVVNRLKEAAGVKSDTELGAIIPVSAQAISKARKNGRVPPDWVLTIGLKFGKSLDWLFWGEAAQELLGENKKLKEQLASLQWKTSVPVLGLAECGIKGWQVKKSSSLKTQPPPDMTDPKGAFAVISLGDSMAPLGINDGFLLYCDETTEPEMFDIVYVEQNDNRATVKQFVGFNERGKDRFMVLQGFLPSKDNLPQKPFTIEVAQSQVARLAVVRYIKRGL